MTKPDFEVVAAAFLSMRRIGTLSDVKALAVELERMFELGRAAGPVDATTDMLGKMFSYDGPAKPKR